MSVPPQGGWNPPQPGDTPPPPSVPYGPPPWGGQPQWSQQPGPPPRKGSGLKWLLIGVGLLLVIAITIGATLLFTRGSGNGTPTATSAPPTSGTGSDIASANDTGPIAVITSEPTCDAWNPIRNTLAQVERNGWDQRDPTKPASDWTPDQRTQADAVGTAMRNAADQTVALARRTPHRVVRELYAQFIAYGRAYADSVATYTPPDDFLAGSNVSATSSLGAICDAITYGSATRSVTLLPVGPPSQVTPPGDPSDPQPFITKPDSTCVAWVQREDKFITDLNDWIKLDPNVAGSQWTPEQRATQEAAALIFMSYASDIEAAGRHSDNPVLEDVAVLSSLYFRAYVAAGTNYVVADNYLAEAGSRLSNLISAACQSAAG
jgi:hypothetical protein